MTRSGVGHVLAEQVVVAVVDVELGVAEVEAGEELVLLEDVIGDIGLVGIALHVEPAQLLVAGDEERELRLERRSGFALIEAAQEGIVFRLADALGVQGFGDYPAERALADSDRTFDCDIPGWFEKVRHGRRKATTRRISCSRFRGNWSAVALFTIGDPPFALRGSALRKADPQIPRLRSG